MAPDKKIFRKLAADSSILALNYAVESNYEDNVLWDYYAWYFYYAPPQLKRNYFAIIVHGSPDQVCGGNAKNLFRVVNGSYNACGFNRGLLMLSCYSGIQIAPALSEIMKVPVLAGTSAVQQNDDGNWQVARLPGDDVDKARLTWVLCYRNLKRVVATTVLQPNAAVKALSDLGWPTS